MTCVLLTSGLAGCGRSDLPELGTVSGVVTLNNEPLADVIVNFSPAGPGRPSAAVTGADGRYSLEYLPGIDGAITGEHVVTVELVTTADMDDLPDDPSEMTAEQKQSQITQLPPAATDGTLKKEVIEGDNSIDITL